MNRVAHILDVGCKRQKHSGEKIEMMFILCEAFNLTNLILNCNIVILKNMNVKKIIIINSILFCFVVFAGCGILFPKLKSEKLNCDDSGITFYFPFYERVRYRTDSIGTIRFATPIKPNDSLNLQYNYWFSKYLCRMGEPILYNKTNQRKSVIRYSNFGAWGSPYSVRIEQKGANITISYNVTKGNGNIGDLNLERGTNKINLEKWNLIIAEMDSIDFWKWKPTTKKTFLMEQNLYLKR